MFNFALELKDISKQIHSTSGEVLNILNGINFCVESGESVAIIGPSGSGKTTFLQICGLLQRPTFGSVWINGINCCNLTDAGINNMLAKEVAFVYQFHHLLPEFSALDNVAIPMMINGIQENEARKIAMEVLVQLGLQGRAEFFPTMLSGGELQRVAIARAVAKNPKIILADEPTGNLDPDNAAKAFDLLLHHAKKKNTCLICVTHNHKLAKMASKTFKLEGGVLSKYIHE